MPETTVDPTSSTVDWQVPTFVDVLAARRRIAAYLQPTPLRSYATLSELVGTEVLVKHENHQPTGAFKVRGGLNLVAQLSDDERRRGVMAASTGNHGQAIAYAARLFGVAATIFVPQGANPVKVASIRALGAEVVFHGRDFDDARERCEALAAEQGRRYVDSGNEPRLIAGVATQTLEVFESDPQIEAILVPVGGGSAAAGACIVARAIDPSVRVIGVQSSGAPAAQRSWMAHHLVEDGMETFAEGLATRKAFELPQRILRDKLDDFTLVSDDDIRRAMLRMLETTGNLIEAAGAAPLAAALALREQLAGRRIVLIASGGNVSPAQLAQLVQQNWAG